MAFEFTMTHRVEFADTDAAGIMHFSAFFRYMEITEHAFYRSLGFSVVSRTDKQISTWPRLSVSCEFTHPLKFEDTFDVRLRVTERLDKTVTYRFDFMKDSHPVASGSMKVIHAVLAAGSDRMRATSIPPSIACLLEIAPMKTHPKE